MTTPPIPRPEFALTRDDLAMIAGQLMSARDGILHLLALSRQMEGIPASVISGAQEEMDNLLKMHARVTEARLSLTAEVAAVREGLTRER